MLIACHDNYKTQALYLACAGSGEAVKKRRVVRPVTKEDRQQASMVHRAHTMCLLGRAHLLDTVADDAELQVQLST